MAEIRLLNSYVEIKCQLDATEVFIADLIACSKCFGHHYAHHQELKGIIQKKTYQEHPHTAPRHSTHLVTNLDNTRHLRLRTQIPQKLTKLFFTFLQHEIPQVATTVQYS